MAAHGCDSLCKDIESVHSFLRAQSRVTNVVVAQQSHCQGIMNRISEFEGIDFDGATALVNVIDAGPWTPEQKQSMSDAIQSRLQDVVIGKSVKTRRKNQTLSSFDRYLSESDIPMLSASDSSHSNKVKMLLFFFGCDNQTFD